MNTSEILKLIDAGYTKAEIEAMEGVEMPDIKEEPKPEELKSEESKEEPKENSEQFSEALKTITDEIKAMRTDFQKHMLRSDDTPIVDPLAESEKILASIIDPPSKKRKEK